MPYFLTSVVRAQQNRLTQMRAPERHRPDVFVGKDKRRVREGRPLLVQDDWFLEHLDEIKLRVKEGRLAVTTDDRRPVNLETLQPLPRMPEPPSPIEGSKLIKDDDPFPGVPMPRYPGSVAVPEDVPLPLKQIRTPVDPDTLPDVIPGVKFEAPAPLTDLELEAPLPDAVPTPKVPFPPEPLTAKQTPSSKKDKKRR